MRVARMLPSAVLTSGLALAALPALAMVKATIAQVELTQAANLMHMDWLTHCERPPVSRDELTTWLRDNTGTKTERDVSLDHWGRPYGAERVAADRVRLYSMGLNGARDGCAPFRASAAIEQWLGSFAERVEARGDDAGSLLDEPMPQTFEPGEPDDICVEFDLPPCQVEPGTYGWLDGLMSAYCAASLPTRSSRDDASGSDAAGRGMVLALRSPQPSR